MRRGRVNVLAVIAVVVVAGTIAAGLIFAGSPSIARQRRLDARRREDLQLLTRSIDAYYSHHQALPPFLDTLSAVHELNDIPVDPETHAPYRYEVTGPTGYRLCATFEQPADDAYGAGTWGHGIGSVCFDLTPLTRGRNAN
jgi:type II secretory pathway pseudopilin PulG